MPDHRLPKMCLFSWLPQTRPKGGPRRRWRDLAKTDLKTVGLSDGSWYDKALDRKQWRDMKKLVESHQPQPRGMRSVLCSECGRSFSREVNKARHKCRVERAKPVSEQVGAVQCKDCERWFRSKGGLAVHTCRREEDDESEEQLTNAAAVDVICSVCGRNFARPGDLKRHKCLQERLKPVKDQQGAVQCGVCQRWFRSAGGLAVHRRTHNPQPS